MDYVGHKGFFSLTTLRDEILSEIPVLWWKQDQLRTRVRDAIFHGNVRRDLNEPLHLQSRIVNASLGKTRRVSTSNERYTSIANKPYNLWANIDNFTRERNEPEITLEVDSDQGYKSPISWAFVKRPFNAPGCVQQAGITSDKIKWKYTDISAPICFHCLLSFPRWAPSPQTPPTPWPTTPGWGHKEAASVAARFVGHLPHSGDRHPGTERRAAAIWMAQGPARSCVQALRFFALNPRGVGEAAGGWENAGAAWNCMGSVKGQGQRS